MASRSKKVFWGLILASVHIRIFDVALFPSCVGMALLYIGILDLEKSGDFFLMRKKVFPCYLGAAAALVLASGILNFMSIFRQEPDETIWIMVPCILEYIVLYFLMEGYTVGKPQLAGLRRGYALVMGGTLVGYGISLMVHTPAWQILFAIIILVCRLMVLTAVYSDKKAKNSASDGTAKME